MTRETTDPKEEGEGHQEKHLTTSVNNSRSLTVSGSSNNNNILNETGLHLSNPSPHQGISPSQDIAVFDDSRETEKVNRRPSDNKVARPTLTCKDGKCESSNMDLNMETFLHPEEEQVNSKLLSPYKTTCGRRISDNVLRKKESYASIKKIYAQKHSRSNSNSNTQSK